MSQVGQDPGIDLADDTHDVVADHDLGGTRRVHPGHGHLLEATAGGRQRVREHAPDVYRLGGLRSRQGHRQVFGLIGQFLRVVRGEEHLGQLEQPHTERAMRLVVRNRLQQARTQRCPQHALLGGQRVGDGHCVRGTGSGLQLARCEERHRQRLVDAETDENLADHAALLLALAERTGGDRGRQRTRDLAVAVMPRHLLDHVGLGPRVGPKAGHEHGLHVNGVGGLTSEADGLELDRRCRSSRARCPATR